MKTTLKDMVWTKISVKQFKVLIFLNKKDKMILKFNHKNKLRAQHFYFHTNLFHYTFLGLTTFLICYFHLIGLVSNVDSGIMMIW
jgi:hypothetical protein